MRPVLTLTRRGLLAAMVWAACLRPAAAQALASRFDARRDALADVAQAVAQARAQGKRVIVDVGGEWCPWCHVLDRFIAAHDDVRALIDSEFIWLKVNYSPGNRNEALLSRWPKVAGYPHLFVLDGEGRVVRSQVSVDLESSNDYDRAKVVAFLNASRAPR